MTEPALNIFPAERRQFVRAPLRSTALVILPSGQSFSVRTLDISVGGVGVVVEANPQIGLKFRLGLNLPLKAHERVAVEAEAEVMHSVYSRDEHGFKVGLRFTKLDVAAANTIVTYVKSKTW